LTVDLAKNGWFHDWLRHIVERNDFEASKPCAVYAGLCMVDTSMIALVDYGMGNLRSVEKALARVGADVRIVTHGTQLDGADAVVLPGVGAFGDCLKNLARCEMTDALRQFIATGKPFLGICLGMQGLLDSSAEAPGIAGLGILPGNVPRFAVDGLKVPHMGWNRLRFKQPACPLLAGIDDGAYVYFVHSYYCAPTDAGVVCGTTEYGVEFCSMIWRDNVYATQFHPEKSQAVGLKMLENFVGITRRTK
jgi:imidazole glycerol-phosphate synthase subunit HisH